MTDKKIEPIFVERIPEGASLVGSVVEGNAVPLDTAIQGSPKYVWENGLYDEVKESLIRKAADRYQADESTRLFLVERKGLGYPAEFDVAGIRYQVSANVYRF